METQAEMSGTQSKRQKYSSPKRILAHAFEMSRDRWKAKHHAVQAELAQVRQLAAERGCSRDRWRRDYELAQARALAAEQLAQTLRVELQHAQSRCAEREGPMAVSKK